MSKEWNFKQELVAVFGKPIAENPTQYMIEKAFAHHGLDWRYLSLEVEPEDLADAVTGMRAMNFRGGNLYDSPQGGRDRTSRPAWRVRGDDGRCELYRMRRG